MRSLRGVRGRTDGRTREPLTSSMEGLAHARPNNMRSSVGLCLRDRESGVYVEVQTSTDSSSGKSGEKSGCVIPGSFHCLWLGGPHGFLQPLLIARVLRQFVCGTTLQLCSERRNRVPTPTKKSTSWGSLLTAALERQQH